jgi:hypothetical protein
MLDLQEQFLASGLLPYEQSPEKDLFLFSFVTTYLVVVLGCPIESLKNFTVYDFINLETIAYNSWPILPKFYLALLRTYFTTVRHLWVRKDKDISAFCYSPCGKQLVSLTSKFFVACDGSTSYTVDEDIAADLRNHNFVLTIPKGSRRSTKRPRSQSALTIRACRTNRHIQDAVLQKCTQQHWPDLEVLEVCSKDSGRGILAGRHFVEGEILVDYHAPKISPAAQEEMMSASSSDRRSDYLFAGPGGFYLDGSAESCACHPKTRILGRLVNFAARMTDECNVKPVIFNLRIGRDKVMVKRFIILVAVRDISPLEELLYDYGDPNCVEMFGAPCKNFILF